MNMPSLRRHHEARSTIMHSHTASLFDPFWPLMPHTAMGKPCSSMNTDLFCDYCEFHHPSWLDWRERRGVEIRTTESERKMERKYQFWHHFNHTEEEIKGGSINRNRWEEWCSVRPDQLIITGDHQGDGDKDVKRLKQR